VSRTLACLAILLAAVPRAAAQVPQPGEPVRLVLHPAALPEPTLKYPLLPPREDLAPGNAAALYYRAEALLLLENSPLREEVQDTHWDHWFLVPLADLPLDEVRDSLAEARLPLHEVDLAARYRQCDWEADDPPEGAGGLPPDLHGLGRLAVLLGVRARSEMAGKNYAEALHTLQSGYALAHHLGQGPSLNHLLVGEAVVNLMNRELEELVQQPNTPNLSWSLATLPRPFFDPASALDADGALLERAWPWLKRLDGRPLSTDDVRTIRTAIRKKLGDDAPVEAEMDAAVAGAYPEAKRALGAQGYAGPRLDAMPPFQVVALDAVRACRRGRQEYVKWFRVPGGWREPAYRAAAGRYAEARERLDRVVFGGLLRTERVGDPAALEKAYTAIDAVDRRFAALRCVEGLRLYAAGHDGRLPPSLADVGEVPVPADPLTGRPFEYEVHGDIATLTGPLPPGDQPASVHPLTYEMMLRK
jgi:hypothetical protein